MSDHADTIRRVLLDAETSIAPLDALLAENQRLETERDKLARFWADSVAENQRLEAERDLAETYVPTAAWQEYAAAREALEGDAE